MGFGVKASDTRLLKGFTPLDSKHLKGAAHTGRGSSSLTGFTFLEIIVSLTIISAIVGVCLVNITIDKDAEIKRFSDKAKLLIDYGLQASLFRQGICLEINKSKKYIMIREKSEDKDSFSQCLQLKKRWKILSVQLEGSSLNKDTMCVEIKEGFIEKTVIMIIDMEKGVYQLRISDEYDFKKVL